MDHASSESKTPPSGRLDLAALRALAAEGAIDTVIMAAPDMQGRLQGKRVMPRFFSDSVVADASEGCNYLLAVDVEMTPVAGYDFASWDRGYGDFVFRPDIATLRRAAWQEGAAILLCDIALHDGSLAPIAPRSILKHQIGRLAEAGFSAYAATELEFLLFRNSYEECMRRGYRNLDPANLYNVDYSILGTAKVEPVIRKIRNALEASGIQVENSKGECNLGQHEINFAYGPVLDCADGHVLYKEAAKEIAGEENCAISFMAKFNEREGNSCHIHLSLRDRENRAVFAESDGHSRLFGHFIAGLAAHAAELSILFAPNINSYKRYAVGSFAPTGLVWGHDNRTCAFRVLGHGKSLRVENRLPGGDVNPYLALAGMIAAGLDGIARELPPAGAHTGNAYHGDLPRVPRTLADALSLWRNSDFARVAFGDQMVAHYARMAEVEIETFGAAVTDWERVRGFERM
ncbi:MULTISPECIES: glutamine synthetase family protein [Acidiphilium]|uniref:Glutamine synthetase family protein n=1 Tax=Acidiphilium iwatense TaxID=768198 RepID=A0ABS9DY70_9PROT|nr:MULTISPECIES: glutamine synthetase family protein [Acidiphilium]MCF3947693.1 glutamine synthetase family protein [Acidiphilium iwatense]